jgi:hypothetical protein
MIISLIFVVVWCHYAQASASNRSGRAGSGKPAKRSRRLMSNSRELFEKRKTEVFEAAMARYLEINSKPGAAAKKQQ